MSSNCYLNVLGALGALILISETPVRAETSTFGDRPNSSEDSGNLGVGLMLGEPTGLSAKLWLSQTNAVDMGFAYSFNSYFTFSSDYLWHFENAINTRDSGKVPGAFVPYAGVGGILFVNNSSSARFFSGSNSAGSALGARIPLGLEFLPRAAPMGIFAELSPGLVVVPGIYGFIDASVGGRFYF